MSWKKEYTLEYSEYREYYIPHFRVNSSFVFAGVVSKMGILEHSSHSQNCIKKTNKIPEYARDYKNEYLFIIGLNKEFYKFEDKYENHEYKIYESKYCKDLKILIKRFLRKQEYGYLKDISSFVFKKVDIFYIKDTYAMLKYDLEMFTDDEMSPNDF